jgi:hypothetical protein
MHKVREEKERLGETESPPPLNVNIFFVQVLKKSQPVYDQSQGTDAVFS